MKLLKCNNFEFFVVFLMQGQWLQQDDNQLIFNPSRLTFTVKNLFFSVQYFCTQRVKTVTFYHSYTLLLANIFQSIGKSIPVLTVASVAGSAAIKGLDIFLAHQDYHKHLLYYTFPLSIRNKRRKLYSLPPAQIQIFCNRLVWYPYLRNQTAFRRHDRIHETLDLFDEL